MASPKLHTSTETYTEREDALRARGNVLYGEVAAGGGGNAAGKRSKLQRAQELYKEALDLSCNSEKRASCCKNLGALHYLWAKVELELLPSWNEPAGGSEVPPLKLSGCTQHLSQAMSFFLRAHVEGARAQKPREWMQQIASLLEGLVTWAAEQSRVLAFPEAPILKHVCEELENLGRNNLAFKVEVEALANVELADCLFNSEAACSSSTEEPLNRASQLLKSLPPSAETDILVQRVSRLQHPECKQM